MATDKRLHAKLEEVDEAVRQVHRDKKPRLREILVRNEEARKKILDAENAKKQKVIKIVVKKRLQRLEQIRRRNNTVHYKDDQNRKKQTMTLKSRLLPARNFNIH